MEATDLTLAATVDLDNEIIDTRIALDTMLYQVEQTEKELANQKQMTVKEAWRLGGLLNERKRRTPHGRWLPFLDDMLITQRSANDYMRLARQISSAANLGASIRETLAALPDIREQAQEAANQATVTVIDEHGNESPATPAEILEPERNRNTDERLDESPRDGSDVYRDGKVTDKEMVESLTAKNWQLVGEVDVLREKNDILRNDQPEDMLRKFDGLIAERDTAKMQLNECMRKTASLQGTVNALRKALKAARGEA